MSDDETAEDRITLAKHRLHQEREAQHYQVGYGTGYEEGFAAGQAAQQAADAAVCEARADNRKYGPVGDRISDAVWNEAEACAVSIRAANLPAPADAASRRVLQNESGRRGRA